MSEGEDEENSLIGIVTLIIGIIIFFFSFISINLILNDANNNPYSHYLGIRLFYILQILFGIDGICLGGLLILRGLSLLGDKTSGRSKLDSYQFLGIGIIYNVTSIFALYIIFFLLRGESPMLAPFYIFTLIFGLALTKYGIDIMIEDAQQIAK